MAKKSITLEEYFQKCFALDLCLTPGSSGEYSLTRQMYSKGSVMPVVPMSHQATLMGYEYRTMLLDADFPYYELYRNNECLMTSNGIEMFEQYVPYLRAHGNVLVGGLGLGIIARLMCKKEQVKSITVIEASPDVMHLCSFKDPKIRIVCADFYKFIRESDLSKFDYIYIDTYTQGSDIYPSIVIPTRAFLLEHYPEIPFDFWQEDQLKAEYLLTSLKSYSAPSEISTRRGAFVQHGNS